MAMYKEQVQGMPEVLQCQMQADYLGLDKLINYEIKYFILYCFNQFIGY